MAFSIRQAYDALLRRPGVKHCHICWQHAIDPVVLEDSGEPDLLLEDLACSFTSEEPLHDIFGFEAVGVCGYPWHDRNVKGRTNVSTWQVWHKRQDNVARVGLVTENGVTSVQSVRRDDVCDEALEEPKSEPN